MKKEIEKKIAEVLQKRILDITDEYRGRKQEQGISVFLGYPQKIIDELLELFSQEKQKWVEELIPKEMILPSDIAKKYNLKKVSENKE